MATLPKQVCERGVDTRRLSGASVRQCELPIEMLVQVGTWLPVATLPSFRRTSQRFLNSALKLFERDSALASAFNAHLSGLLQGSNDKRVRVMVRVRPHPGDAHRSVVVERNRISCASVDPGPDGDETSFFFNKAFDRSASQSEVWGYLASPVMRSLLRREHCCLLAYGQTGSGKTHTMFGHIDTESGAGIAYRAVSAVGRLLQTSKFGIGELGETPLRVEFSFLEVYNEKVYDLLADQRPVPLRSERKVLQPATKYTGALYSKEEIVVPVGLTRRKVDSCRIEEQVRSWLTEGAATRTIGKTVFNPRSSRSHAVATLHIIWRGEELPVQNEHCGRNEQSRASAPSARSVSASSMAFSPPARAGRQSTGSMTPTMSTEETRLYLVDLAGSERAGQYALSDHQLKEGVNINKSLSTLGRVVGALSRGRGEHVPYRDSTLTWLLSDAITGRNARAFMVAAVHPAHPAETLSTLRYAQQYSALQSDVSSKIPKLAAEVRNFGREIDAMRFRFSSMLQSFSGSEVWTRDTIIQRVVRVRRDAHQLFNGHPYLEWIDAHKSRLGLRDLGVIRTEVDRPEPRAEDQDADGRRVQPITDVELEDVPEPSVEVVYAGRHGRPAKVLWFVLSALEEVPPPSQIGQRLEELENAEVRYQRMQCQLRSAKELFAAQQKTWMETA